MVVRVKICGLTRRSDVEKAVEFGADALGFVFGYENSPRNLEFEKMKELVLAVPPYVSTVVVSPSSNPRLEEVIAKVKPSFLQLYDETGSNEHRLGGYENVIETVRPKDCDDLIQRSLSLSSGCRAILFDASLTSRYSKGTPAENLSMRSDQRWELGRSLREALDHFPMILSGGLNEKNVADAIIAAKPFAVDVSSGVEAAPGIKDEQKMRQFIQRARIA